jgi:DNA (cytosine-5)-methyltransferase 1
VETEIVLGIVRAPSVWDPYSIVMNRTSDVLHELTSIAMVLDEAVTKNRNNFTSIELCAGAGGQARGLEMSGFRHLALVDNDPHSCATLRTNRPYWNTLEMDLKRFDATAFRKVTNKNGTTQKLDLLAAGVPCPPFSIAGKMLGIDDPRNLFGEVIRLAGESDPNAVMIENVRGLLNREFDDYRFAIESAFLNLGFKSQGFQLVQASDFGVPQLRPRVIFVAIKPPFAENYAWPVGTQKPPSVGEALHQMMVAEGWKGAEMWAERANSIAPTLVGGSKLHGGPDLGPTRARAAWAQLGVNGSLIAESAPQPSFKGMPCLTVQMAAILQGFEDSWRFMGSKTHAYRQVGNAFPPPVAAAIGTNIRRALSEKAN